MYACPKCGSDDLRVEARVVRVIVQTKDGDVFTERCDGADDSWDSDSPMVCQRCDHSAPALDFDTEQHRPPARPSPIALLAGWLVVGTIILGVLEAFFP
jgi:hypothetical protein